MVMHPSHVQVSQVLKGSIFKAGQSERKDHNPLKSKTVSTKRSPTKETL